MKILVTGAAGFIGYHICSKLLEKDYEIFGLDNLNSYYDISLKKDRLKKLLCKKKSKKQNFKFKENDIVDKIYLRKIFEDFQPNVVIHLAAQAGVRFSISNPEEYINSNLLGFANILECCRIYSIKNFIFASSSSVYGGNKKIPFSEKSCVDHPVSLYAATKRSNELMAHSYSHLYGLPSTALRLFTVYGPWGRPDMSPMIFADAILNNKPIQIFNNGNLSRDFTYIDDVSEVFARLINKPANKNENFFNKNPDSASSWAPFRIFNVGNTNSINLMEFIGLLEKNLDKKAIKVFKEMQPGDVKDTLADTHLIEDWIDFAPNTTIEKGIKEFVSWYKNYKNIY